MPNTLAHLGLQSLATRGLISHADLRWIGLGAVIPDFPWILQRAVRVLGFGIDPYELRLFAIAQATLAASLLLCGAFALVSAAPRRVFVILAFNAVLHLLLDAVQIKWANGVHLWAPFAWELWNAGWFWPESVPTYALTALGPVVFIAGWWRGWAAGSVIDLQHRRRLVVALAFLIAYVTLPIAARKGPEHADNHFVATLTSANRTDRYVELDRNLYRLGDGADTLVVLAGERLLVPTRVLTRDAVVSARATFADDSTLVVHEIHDHSDWPRDHLSLAGLALVALAWAWPRRRLRDQPRTLP